VWGGGGLGQKNRGWERVRGPRQWGQGCVRHCTDTHMNRSSRARGLSRSPSKSIERQHRGQALGSLDGGRGYKSKDRQAGRAAVPICKKKRLATTFDDGPHTVLHLSPASPASCLLPYGLDPPHSLHSTAMARAQEVDPLPQTKSA
jgi:hypothetical protein